MIQNRKYRILCDQRAKITSGEKTEEGYPRSLHYFDVSPFPELVKAYGEQPEELLLYFPSDNIPDFFNDDFNLYGSNGQKKRSCDGVTCIHRIKETINGITYEPGQESSCVCKDLPDGDKNKCKYVMYLKAWIALPDTWKIENPLCYLFMTHSRNSGDNIYSELEKIKTLAGGILRGIKFQINVRMVAGKDDAKKRFPIWSLQSVGMMSDIRDQVTGRAYGIEQEEIKAIEQDKKAIEQTEPEEPKKEIKKKPPQKKEQKEKKLKARGVYLAEIWTTLETHFSDKKEEKLNEMFGEKNWEKIKTKTTLFPPDVLARGLEVLIEQAEGEDADLPFKEDGSPKEEN